MKGVQKIKVEMKSCSALCFIALYQNKRSKNMNKTFISRLVGILIFTSKTLDKSQTVLVKDDTENTHV